MQNTEQGQVPQDNEIYLADILRFFYRNGTLMGLMTVGLSVIIIALSLLQPKPYQKQLTLLVLPVSISTSPPLPGLDITQASNIVLKFLEGQPLDAVNLQPTYDTATGQINLTLSSPNLDALKTATSQVQSEAEIIFQDFLSKKLETSLTAIDLDLERNRQALNELEEQSTQFSSSTEFRLGALETYKAQKVASITELEFNKQYLEQAQDSLAKLTNQAIPIQILLESEISPGRSSLQQVAIIAVIASFMVAIFVALIREQIPVLKAELSKNKISH